MSEQVAIRRRLVMPAVLAASAGFVAAAFLIRGVTHFSVWSLLVGLALAALAATQAMVLREGRTPLLLADEHGFRLRLGQDWCGLPWTSLRQVVVEPATSLWRDGRLVLAPNDLNRELNRLDDHARRQIAWNQRLYAAPLAIPLGATTEVSTDDLVAALARLSAGRTPVTEMAGHPTEPITPVEQRIAREERVAARAEARLAAAGGSFAESAEDGAQRLAGKIATFVSRASLWGSSGRSHDIDADQPAPVEMDNRPDSAPLPSVAPAPMLRSTSPVARVDVRLETQHNSALAYRLDADDAARGTRLPEEAALRRGEHDPWATDETPDAPLPHLVIDDLDIADGLRPALIPVIGPQLRHGREAMGLSIEEVSRRTKIREHLIEAIEVDDFTGCGGDFYARGHLRSLAGVLGIDPTTLITAYDDHYATGPIAARTVFEAELAHNLTGGRFAGLRVGTGGLGGPRWSLMLAVVLILALAWGVARMLSPAPATVTDPTPQLNGSAGVQSAPITSAYGAPVSMTVRAVNGPSTVLVRDHSGKILWSGDLAKGQQQRLFGTGPFDVQSSDGSAVAVWVDGKARGAVGIDHNPANGKFR